MPRHRSARFELLSTCLCFLRCGQGLLVLVLVVLGPAQVGLQGGRERGVLLMLLFFPVVGNVALESRQRPREERKKSQLV